MRQTTCPYPNCCISFVLCLSNASVFLHLGCTSFTQGVQVILRKEMSQGPILEIML